VKTGCYFDYTCSYSYRAWLWLDRLQSSGEELAIDWRSFVLKEVNREAAEQSALAGPRIESVAVLAHALSIALRSHDSWHEYHERTFRAMHEGGSRATKEDVARIAREAGLDLAAFHKEEALWLEQVKQEHFFGVGRWRVFGTPTLILDDKAAVYLKLEQLPGQSDRKLWDALWTISVSFPEVIELKRPPEA
jgi:hypothetical protein